MDRKCFNALMAQYETPKVEGNGVATWDGGIKCCIPSVKISGGSKQETLTGSNLLPYKAPSTYDNGYGIMITSYEDQSFILNGTSTAANHYWWYDPNSTPNSLPKGTYAFVNRDNTTKHTASYIIQCFDSKKAHVKNLYASDAAPYITIDGDYLLRICVWWNHGLTFSNERYLMQLSYVGSDNVIPPYEPYCGGIPAPNPNYPISVACNNGTYQITGRNLLPDFSEIYANLTSYGSGYHQYIFHVPPNTPVTICSPHEKDTGMQFYLYALPDTTGKYGGSWMYHPMEDAYQNDSITITSGADGIIKLVGYGWDTAKNTGILENNLWAVIGDQPLPYEPYVDGGCVTAPLLHGIPGTPYRDEWNAVTGVGIRRCGRVVLDGNHDYYGFASTTDGLGYAVTLKNVVTDMRNATYGNNYCISTHHKAKLKDASAGVAYGEMIRHIGTRHVVLSFPPSCTSVELCKAWLAEQYNAGTPVTLIYDLATPVTFYSEPTAKLIQPNGYGKLIQTAGDVPDCPVSVTYVKHC